MVSLAQVLALSACLFGLGLLGVVLRRDWLAVLLSLQVMISASVLALATFNRRWTEDGGGALLYDGQALALLALCVAAAQIAVGLGIVIAAVRNRESVTADDASSLKW